MSHVDDGALHAYLDGALDTYPAGDAVRVREHLDACPECARRLEEERAVRAEAEAILASSAPVVRMPPLEELRAVAERRAEASRARGLSRLNRWSWAASVVLALGTGWMLRGAIPGMVSRPAMQDQAAEPSVATQSADGIVGAVVKGAADEAVEPDAGGGASFADDREAAREDFAAAAPAERDLDAAAELRPAEAGEAAGGRGAAEAISGERNVAEAVSGERDAVEVVPASAEEEQARPAAPSLTQAAPVPVDSVGILQEAAARQAAPTRAEQALPDRRVEPSAAGVEFRGRGVRARPAESSAPAGAADAAKSVVSGGGSASLEVPGLALVDVSWVEDTGSASGWVEGATGARAVRVRQLMENGDTLQVIHMPPGSLPSTLPRAQVDGTTQLVVPDGDGWVILRARAPRDTLEAYLTRLMGG